MRGLIKDDKYLRFYKPIKNAMILKMRIQNMVENRSSVKRKRNLSPTAKQIRRTKYEH